MSDGPWESADAENSATAGAHSGNAAETTLPHMHAAGDKVNYWSRRSSKWIHAEVKDVNCDEAGTVVSYNLDLKPDVAPSRVRRRSDATHPPVTDTQAPARAAGQKPATTSLHKARERNEFFNGEHVKYWSNTHSQWVDAYVTKVNRSSDGRHVLSYDLTAKNGADISRVRKKETPADAPPPAPGNVQKPPQEIATYIKAGPDTHERERRLQEAITDIVARQEELNRREIILSEKEKAYTLRAKKREVELLEREQKLEEKERRLQEAEQDAVWKALDAVEARDKLATVPAPGLDGLPLPPPAFFPSTGAALGNSSNGFNSGLFTDGARMQEDDAGLGSGKKHKRKKERRSRSRRRARHAENGVNAERESTVILQPREGIAEPPPPSLLNRPVRGANPKAAGRRPPAPRRELSLEKYSTAEDHSQYSRLRHERHRDASIDDGRSDSIQRPRSRERARGVADPRPPRRDRRHGSSD